MTLYYLLDIHAHHACVFPKQAFIYIHRLYGNIGAPTYARVLAKGKLREKCLYIVHKAYMSVLIMF